MQLDHVERLSRDLRKAAVTLSDEEVRYLVDAYYIMQTQRIRADGQIRALSETKEPHEILTWLSGQSHTLENQVRGALDRYTDAHPIGRWMKSIDGIGPVLSAGLLAHIDITRAATVGHIWRFAGLDPTQEWKEGKKRPWNATLKTLCWKLGESFVKVSGKPDAFYGQVYATRKEWEIKQNQTGQRSENAARVLAKKKFRKDTVAKAAYEAGRLPDAHVHAMAKRYTVKLFLSHLHHKWYEHAHGEPPPKPYAITQLGHGHYIPPPD